MGGPPTKDSADPGGVDLEQKRAGALATPVAEDGVSDPRVKMTVDLLLQQPQSNQYYNSDQTQKTTMPMQTRSECTFQRSASRLGPPSRDFESRERDGEMKEEDSRQEKAHPPAARLEEHGTGVSAFHPGSFDAATAQANLMRLQLEAEQALA